jgi:ergothioneine biosynthesis protein EgtB
MTTANFDRIRAATLRLCQTLEPVQTMPDVSPTKWHLAHVTWFFERFVLEEFDDNYRRFSEQFDFLFNSYYYSAGTMHARPKRGLLTRPTLTEVFAYRAHVDDAMRTLLKKRADDAKLLQHVELGLHHEQQHQELLLTDIKHVLSCNPLLPAMNPSLPAPPSVAPAKYALSGYRGGVQQFGAATDGFCFDNELPRHDALVQDHRIGKRLVTNAEYRDFIDAGGYSDSQLWLSDGWSRVNERGWNRPLYWSEDLKSEFTLGGLRKIDPHAPVCHVSYYEADSFARWAGARLPTEFEWEHAAATEDVTGNFVDSGFWQPIAGDTSQFFGDVWEWTSSAYSPYPGFTPLEGSLGEYNGKFMSGQMTVRGGSCATPRDHIRTSYRSFFYPDARWQFLGIRLAKDGRS